MEVIVDVNENDIVNVGIGDSAQVEVDAFPNKRFKARVTEIAYSANVSGLGNVDQITNYKVSVLIEPSSYLKDADVMRGIDPRNQSPFRPGMTAVVNVFTEQAPNVVAVPLGAVTIDRSGEGDKAKPQASGAPAAPGAGAQPSSKSLANIQRSQEIVYVYDSTTKKVSAVPVSSGLADDDYIEIKKGLESGQRVVKGPYQAVAKLLKDGTVVRVKKAENRRKSS
jgi:HlyD family secretion protein